MIRWPSMAAVSDTVFIAANLFPVRGNTLDARPLYLGRLHVGTDGQLVGLAPLDLPKGDFQFAYPRIVAADGRLHLVWAEFATRPSTTSMWTQSLATTLWHAVLDKGTWSVPEAIASSRWLGWSDEAGGAIADGAGNVHVVVWSGDSIPRVRHVRLRSGHRDTSEVSSVGLNHSTAIAALGDTLVVALVDVASDTQRVSLAVSPDQGEHWSHPIPVSRRANGWISHLGFATSSKGQTLAIGEKKYDSFYLDTLRIVSTRAVSLSAVRAVPLPPAAASFDFAPTPCGSAVLLVRSFTVPPQTFRITVERDLSATAPRPLVDGAGFTTFSSVIATRRSAIAVFGYAGKSDTLGRSVGMALPTCSP